MRLAIQIVALLVLGTAALVSQRAQLGRKGRQPEPSESAIAGKPLRTLPRARGARPLPAVPSPLAAHIERLRATAVPRHVSRVTAMDSSYALAAAPPLRLLPKPGPPMIYAAAFVTPTETEAAALFAEVPNRWNLAALQPDGGEFPEWQRYENTNVDLVHHRSHFWDPYDRNRLKGDYPIWGRKTFLNIAASSATLAEFRRVPVSSPPSGAEPGTFPFFGRGEQFAVQESLRVGISLFHGSAGFKPVDWEIKVTPEFNINYLLARENSITNIDVRQSFRRTDTNVGFQELYFEKRLFTNSWEAFRRNKSPDYRGSAQFDFTSVRLGIQRFTSDFRGFIFSDEQPGVRLFGELRNNKMQYNLAAFNMLEKDTNSGLNRWRDRKQNVYIANLYWFDALTPGYNLNFSLLYNNDQPSVLVDKNGFLARPAPIGTPLPHKIRAGYAGISGDGHIKRINVSHAFYQAFGRDDFNPIAGQPQHINAQLAAMEVSYESDWKTYRASFFFVSGDGKIEDREARGFDGIVPNQQFAGGGFLGNPSLADRGLLNNAFEGGGTNFLNREAIPLTGTSVFLFGPNSLMPTLRPGLFEGQANFVNPGLLLYNLGFDARVTPKLRTTVNVNYLQFHKTEVLEDVLFQSGIRRSIGVDAGCGAQYRPKLNDNIVVTGGFGVLFPQPGFKNIYNSERLYSAFTVVRFQF